ncbi:WD40 repeat domain-containing protein [Taibaiella soli]|uniref:WD40 repeat domain-containing protein n=1 Tax=Taibaiella soli TaxID=1649169 RepID=A0A2W2B078_9BACT|nr:hypothetical protein [Taibaiella soli]PZF73378.1 hypothetical protein DN068_08280 [Taibaiella soli]
MVLEEGYGFSFAFAKDSHWASADIGILHVWNGYSLVESYDVPGFAKGNLFFGDDGVYAGLFFISTITKEKKYLSEITVQLAAGTKAHYSQYRVDEVFHSAENGLMLVAVSYQPPKGLRTSGSFSDVTNRLLLFRRSDQMLLKTVAENADHVPYSHLFLKDGCIVFSVDGYHTRIASAEGNGMPSGMPGFTAFALCGPSILIGAGVQRILSYDVVTSKLLWQSPESVDLVNAIATINDVGFLAAVNDQYLQLWKMDGGGFLLQSSIDLKDTIEGIAVGPSGKCYVALAGEENYIEILDREQLAVGS